MTPVERTRLIGLRAWHQAEHEKAAKKAKDTPGSTTCFEQQALATKHTGFVELLDEVLAQRLPPLVTIPDRGLRFE